MKNIVFDFDGVIHSYTSGWQGYDNIPDPPVEGIRDLLRKIKTLGYNIWIVATRALTIEGTNAVINYLKRYDIPYHTVTNIKPKALVYVDDRGLQFTGDTSDNFLYEILHFQTWKQQKSQFRGAIINASVNSVESLKAKTTLGPQELTSSEEYNAAIVKHQLLLELSSKLWDKINIVRTCDLETGELIYTAELKIVKEVENED